MATSLPTEYSAEAQRIATQRKLAEALQQEAGTPAPTGSMVGNTFIATSPLTHMAKVMQALNARKGMQFADQESKALAGRQEARRGADTSLLVNALSGRKASPGGLTEDASGNVTESDPMKSLTPVEALQQVTPMMGSEMQPAALQATIGAQGRQDTQDFQTRQAQAQQAAHLHERELAIQAQNERARQQQEFQGSQARLAAQDRQGLAQMVAGMRQENRPPVAVLGPDGKPVYVPAGEAAGRHPANPKSGGQLPTSALKVQNDLLDDIGLAGSIDADLGKLVGQMTGGGLEIGPLENRISQARNFIGQSSPNSRAFSSFQSTLEKLRNDSLRLNKGVQTEGDAQRAWNELFANVNDQKNVSNRLQEIQAINRRAAGLKRLQVDTVRQNFGLEPMDVSGFTNQQPAVGAGQQGQPLNPQEQQELAQLRQRFKKP